MLRHSSDREPGFTRKRIGRSWAYFDEKGERITDRAVIERLNAIGLPPAYSDAWFCTPTAMSKRPARPKGASNIATHGNPRSDAPASSPVLEFGNPAKRRRRAESDLNGAVDPEGAGAIVRLLDSEQVASATSNMP